MLVILTKYCIYFIKWVFMKKVAIKVGRGVKPTINYFVIVYRGPVNY